MSGSGLLSKWDSYHQHVFPYGPNTTYAMGAQWLNDQTLVEDWGAGPGWLKTQLPPDIVYRGIDGSKGQNVSEIVDLESYRSNVPAIFMRHVLEHNHNWKTILQNALASFQNKFCLVLFTPLQEGPTKDIRIHFNHVDVPDLSFNMDEFFGIIIHAGCSFHVVAVASGLTAGGLPATEHGSEIFFKIVRRSNE